MLESTDYYKTCLCVQNSFSERMQMEREAREGMEEKSQQRLQEKK